MPIQSKPIPRKIAILGFGATGKTSLATHFVEGRFVERYDPTIENTFQKLIPFHRIKFLTDIVDCAGMDEYSRLSRNASVGVHGYLLVASFEKVKFIDDMLQDLHGGWAELPRVLVGTMIDLQERQVSFDEGQELAENLGIPFVECSSKANINVSEVFTTLLKEIERDNTLFEEQANWDSTECDVLSQAEQVHNKKGHGHSMEKNTFDVVQRRRCKRANHEKQQPTTTKNGIKRSSIIALPRYLCVCFSVFHLLYPVVLNLGFIELRAFTHSVFTT